MLHNSESIDQIKVLSLLLASSSSESEDEILRLAYNHTKETTNIRGMFIALYEEENDKVSFPLAFNKDVEINIPYRNAGEGLTGFILRKGTPLLISKNNDLSPWLGVPMMEHNRIIGVMAIQRSVDDDNFTENDLKFLQIVANLTAIAMSYSRLSNKFISREKEYNAEIEKLIRQKIEYEPYSPPLKDTKKVFISYAREDLEAAQRICHGLRENGFDPWLDKEKLIPGSKWKDEIVEAIRTSQSFLALLSTHSISKKGFVQKELKEALGTLELYPDSTIYLIPVRLDDCQISHPTLRSLQWVEMFPSWEKGIERIMAALKTIDFT